MKTAYHAQTVQEVLAALRSSAQGLSSDEAKNRLEKFGQNVLPQAGKRSPLEILFHQIASLMTYVLLVAAGLSFVFQHNLDAAVILLVLCINISIGFLMEYRAERALQALGKLLVLKAKVRRDGRLHILPATQLVPGDIILLEDGDKVPADARLLQIRNFQTSEAALTGESFPAEKNAEPVGASTILAEQSSMVWMGTLVARGTAEAVVTATGVDTAMGDIARSLVEIPKTPGHFEKRMRRLTQIMALVSIVVAATTFLIGVFWRGFPVMEMLVFAVAALVSGIPEGLPVILAIVLAIGSHRMSKRNAIVRRLPAIETLGVVTVVVTDKTGTLTWNKMSVQGIALPERKPTVGGGAAFLQTLRAQSHEEKGFHRLLSIAAVCHSVKKTADHTGKDSLVGDPTEVALVEFAAALGLDQESDNIRFTKIDDLGFQQEQRWRACLVESKENPGKKYAFVIGATEAVLSASLHSMREGKSFSLGSEHKKMLLEEAHYLTGQAMRVVSFGFRPMPADEERLSIKDVKDLTFVGSVGMIDPPRPEVLDALRQAKQAGVRVIMATGDHPRTAVAIAKQIGLLDKDDPGSVVNGTELIGAGPEIFDKIAQNAVVCARFTPATKLQLAAALQRQGEIVAMTGDGVNDAPALKQADVGISMAIAGTEVARESSEVVLADDNFASIIHAIEEGRTQFRNARRTALFLVTTNIAESVTILATILIGWPLPLLATQILWLNLVTDSVTDIALAVEPTHEDVLKAPPRDPKEQILTPSMLPYLAITTSLMATLTLIVFFFFMETSIEKARTGAFVVMAWTQLFNVLNMRSLKASVFEIGLFSNKWVILALLLSVLLMFGVLFIPVIQRIFSFVTLSALEMFVLFAISSLALWVVEIYKIFCRITGFCKIG